MGRRAAPPRVRQDDVLRDPEVQAIGRRLRSGRRTRQSRARPLLRDRVRFAREVGEVFQSPTELVRLGVGDCDCHARAAFAFLGAAGVGAHGLPRSKGGGPRRRDAGAHVARWRLGRRFAAPSSASPRAAIGPRRAADILGT